MYEPKEEAFERIGQSVKLFFKNYFWIAVFMLTLSIVNTFVIKFFTGNIITEKLLGWSTSAAELYTPQNMILLIVWIIWFLVFSLLNIPVLTATIKSIQQAYRSEKIHVKDNFSYALRNFIGILQVYVMKFFYIYGIAVAIFIIGLLMILIWLIGNVAWVTESWMFIAGISWLIGLVYLIIRWVRATIVMVAAVDSNDFWKENFKKTIALTKNNWWRMVWNLLIVFIIIAIIGWIGKAITWAGVVSQISDVVSETLWEQLNATSLSNDIDPMSGSITLTPANIDTEALQERIKSIFKWRSIFDPVYIFVTLFWILVQVSLQLFWLIFIFFLYKRLQLEALWAQPSINNTTAKKSQVIQWNENNNVIVLEKEEL